MHDIIYSSFILFSLWVLLCRNFQTHASRLKQNDILFHPLLPDTKDSIFQRNFQFEQQISHCSKKFEMARSRDTESDY